MTKNTVWILTIEDRQGSEENPIICCWANRPTAIEIENLANIYIDSEVAKQLETDGIVEDSNIENYFYVLKKYDVTEN